MRATIVHESRGRLRLRLRQKNLTLRQADLLETWLKGQPWVREAAVHERTGCLIVTFTGERETVLSALGAFTWAGAEASVALPDHSTRAMNREFQEKLVGKVAVKAAATLFLPAPLRIARVIWHMAPFLRKGLRCLGRRQIKVELLDALSIGISACRRDFGTAGTVMFLLEIGELLEDWTRKKSVADLAESLSLHVDRVWLKNGNDEVLVSIGQVKPGDLVVVRAGGVIPLDGVVAEGEITVNQVSLTGESVPVAKRPGGTLYAGTVVEEGEFVVRVEKAVGGGRYDRIVKMIEESEKLKSTAEDKASRLADRLVPYTLGGTALTYLLTRNTIKALAVLMVDFSCALKLSMPIAVLSAMRESSGYHISVKGGRFMEAVANADTVVFDKTGTLTYATPTVAKVVSFDGYSASEMLRLAACLEEHYPHSIANAVVAEAKRLGLDHKEYHSQVEYVVAHGISSTVEDKKVIIGSAHFVFEDEGCVVPEAEQEKFNTLPEEYSHLYLCIAGRLAAVICISDPLRKEAKDAIQALHACGISKVVMMTGDSRRTAEAVAREVGVDQFYAEVLPEDKANFVRQEKAAGRKVIMIGDGVNDTPALSEADVGIAINTGAAIAREIADVTIASEDLFELVTLRKISQALMGRIQRNYRFIVGFNLMLIVLGVTGVIQPTTSALLHNASTLGISLDSMTDLLDKDKEKALPETESA